ncbi:hypothetical protein Leryth_022708 [Lithospermum erythrorhizon]|nr:hypothetical protein Leryth_022708 [Lithospermum erythrorhizon]
MAELSGAEGMAGNVSLIELRTAPVDFHFPTTNQARHCFTRYIQFHRLTGGMNRGRMGLSMVLSN